MCSQLEKGTANLIAILTPSLIRIVVAKSVCCSVLDLMRTRLSVVLYCTNIPKNKTSDVDCEILQVCIRI